MLLSFKLSSFPNLCPVVLSLAQYISVPGKLICCRQRANTAVPSAQDSKNGKRFGEMAHADCVRRRIMLESAKKNPNHHQQ